MAALCRRAAARPAAGRRSRQAAPSRPQRARHAGRGAGLRDARDAQSRRPVADMLRQTHGRVREATTPERVKAIEAADDAVDRLYEAIKLYLDPDLAHRAGRGGRPALRRDPDLHHQPRAYRRHHRQEPDGTRRQEDQEPLRLLARRPGRAARLPCPRAGQPAAGAERVHDARHHAGPPPGRREDRDARGRGRVPPTATSPACARAGRNRSRPARSTWT